MLLLPLGKGGCSCVENVEVKVELAPKYEWNSYHKSCSLKEVCKEEIEHYKRFLDAKKRIESKRYYLTEKEKEQLKGYLN
jgi:hypothetical protein